MRNKLQQNHHYSHLQRSSDSAEGITNLKAPALPKHAQNKEHSLPEIKVDVFGPYVGKNEDKPIVKRAEQVGRFLSCRVYFIQSYPSCYSFIFPLLEATKVLSSLLSLYFFSLIFSCKSINPISLIVSPYQR